MDRRRSAAVPLVLLLAGCAAPGGGSVSAPPRTDPPATVASPPAPPTVEEGKPFATREVTRLDRPWAMTFLPSGRALVTEKGGALKVVDTDTGRTTTVQGTPEVVDAGQGGLADVALGPTFAEDGTVYLSWVEQADGARTRGVVGRGTLDLEGDPQLTDLEPVWRQDPADSDGHFSLRLAVTPDGENLMVTSGERQKMTPAQDISTNLGKILRLTLDGGHVEDNPFVDQHDRAAQIWSYGHRNPLGIAFDGSGNLWASEMGPKGGDELNLVEPGVNYGWPDASEGSHYDGRAIPRHPDTADVEAPKAFWAPSISPANLMIYTGEAFPQWQGDAFLGGLSGQVLTRVDLQGTSATKAEEWDMGTRVREVEQGPDGSIFLLTDGPDGVMLQLTPPS